MLSWLAVKSWLGTVPKWVWWALLALAGLWALREDARRDERNKNEADREREERRAVENTHSIKEEARHDADEALAARDSAYSSPTDSMSDTEFELTFGYPRTPEQVS
ncbi:MAG: hypothetical protein AAGK02_09710 [Pseudomonadota bacterium]